MEKLMSVEELAATVDVPVATIYQWNHKGTGPPPIRVGRYLRFDPREVREWLEMRKRST